MNMYDILYVRVSTESKRKTYDKKSCYVVRGVEKKNCWHIRSPLKGGRPYYIRPKGDYHIPKYQEGNL